MGLEWNWREAPPCNLLISQWLSVDYTLLRSSISEKRPSSCDIGASCWDASCAALWTSACLWFAFVFVRCSGSCTRVCALVKQALHAGRCELCIQLYGCVLGYAMALIRAASESDYTRHGLIAPVKLLERFAAPLLKHSRPDLGFSLFWL